MGILILSGIMAASVLGYRKSSTSQEIKEIEAISGSSFCGDGKIVDAGRVGDLNIVRPPPHDRDVSVPRPSSDQIRHAILSSFPDNDAPCIDLGRWPELMLQNERLPLKKMTGFVEIGEAKIPLVLTRRENNRIQAQDFNQRLIVRLSGGPGLIPIGSISDYFIQVRTNDLLIDFFYSGSGTNLIYPKPNFNVAASQVRSFLAALRRRNPEAEIVLVGESLGGSIALRSMEGTSSMVDKIVLLSPTASSMQSFVDRSRSMANQVEERSLMEIYRVLESEADDWSTRDIRRLNRIDVLSNFFSEDALGGTIVDRVAKISGTPILVIYGDRDPIIGLDEIKGLRGVDAVSLEEISGMGHSFSNLGHVNEMRYAIESFLD